MKHQIRKNNMRLRNYKTDRWKKQGRALGLHFICCSGRECEGGAFFAKVQFGAKTHKER